MTAKPHVRIYETATISARVNIYLRPDRRRHLARIAAKLRMSQSAVIAMWIDTVVQHMGDKLQ